MSVYVLWVLCVPAYGIKMASVKNGDPSFHKTDLMPLKISRHYNCLPSDSVCVLKCSASRVQEANLTWFKENQVCSQVSVVNRDPNPSLKLFVDDQDKSNYSCVLNNQNSSMTLYLNIPQHCEPCPANTQTSQTVKTGDSVTLHTNLEAIPEDVFIRWFYGPNEALIAEVSKDHISMCVLEELKGRLLVDSQTGDLTITNTSTTDSGIFKLQINKEFRECWSFNVTVIDRLPGPQISNQSKHCPSLGSKCVVECFVENVKSKATLSCYKENRLLSSINITDLNYLCLEYKDKGNYSCVISNSFISETKYLIISEVCAEKSHTLEIILGALALFVLALVIYFYIRIQRRQEGKYYLQLK
ncbi:opioid-binding protein/cell adhesion molecule homolog [Carassius gibelio]|uniref:opioid-binding protein/cell adhesion molecule homolog n=1 Tax=Carassius gibelio TaxID=101364 RepID=UPI0022790630|nr:opioid-binding protein/cell adhesion molecule homolog [Carassius gibelio]